MTFAKTEHGGSDKMPNDIQTCVRYKDGYQVVNGGIMADLW